MSEIVLSKINYKIGARAKAEKCPNSPLTFHIIADIVVEDENGKREKFENQHVGTVVYDLTSGIQLLGSCSACHKAKYSDGKTFDPSNP